MRPPLAVSVEEVDGGGAGAQVVSSPRISSQIQIQMEGRGRGGRVFDESGLAAGERGLVVDGATDMRKKTEETNEKRDGIFFQGRISWQGLSVDGYMESVLTVAATTIKFSDRLANIL